MDFSADGDAAAGHRYRRALECLLGVPATDGNRVDVLRNGDRAFPAMLEAIAAAERTVDLQTYGYWRGSIGEQFARALMDRVRAGVRVRILLDAFGARQIDRRLVATMRAAGAQVQWFRPLTNWRVTQSTHRGHRKTLVCDGAVAFTGGWGISDEWMGDARDHSEWRDTQLRIRGPAVNGLRGAFVNNWAETGLPLFDEHVDPFLPQAQAGRAGVQVVQGEAETGWGDISTLAHALIRLARRSVRITAGYFVPDRLALELLCEAPRRGVGVDVLRPAPDVEGRLPRLASQAQYQELLRAGVRIWSYRPTALHTRAISVDGVVADVGPVNLNSRSLTLDDEVNVVLFDRQAVGVLDEHFDTDLERADPVEPDRWNRRGRAEKAREAAVGFVARHL